jgi:hypothetical protein
MSRHATAEVLSAYVDDELEPPVRLRLVEHLEECDECSQRLESMRRTVVTLRRLERAAPPPLLASAVRRQVALGPERRRGWVERWERRLPATPQGSPLFFSFALILCLGLVVYLFAHGVERSRQPRTALIVGKLPQAPVPTGEVVETRTLGAGNKALTYELVDGLWRLQGLQRRGADLRVAADSAEGRELLRLHPGVETLGERVLLRLDELVVELYGLPGSAAADAASDAETVE